MSLVWFSPWHLAVLENTLAWELPWAGHLNVRCAHGLWEDLWGGAGYQLLCQELALGQLHWKLNGTSTALFVLKVEMYFCLVKWLSYIRLGQIRVWKISESDRKLVKTEAGHLKHCYISMIFKFKDPTSTHIHQQNDNTSPLELRFQVLIALRNWNHRPRMFWNYWKLWRFHKPWLWSVNWPWIA